MIISYLKLYCFFIFVGKNPVYDLSERVGAKGLADMEKGIRRSLKNHDGISAGIIRSYCCGSGQARSYICSEEDIFGINVKH
jgi:hypothetical protein